MAKGTYIGTEKIITVTNLLDYNTLSNNNGGYWGKWNLSEQTDYVNWSSGLYPPGGQRCGRFNKNITSGLAEATYQLTVQSGSIKVSLNSSHLYYFSIYLYQTSIVGSFACYWPIAEPPAVSNFTVSQINTWERHSAIFNRNSFSNGNYDVRFDFDDPTDGAALSFGNVALVDLTATFGAGFEPDKEWCDENLNFLDSSSTLASETATITVNYSVARKVKKMYIGINDVARKVKKGYIGVGGVARPFFSGGEPSYYGQVEAELHKGKYNLAAGSIGEYALFAGGRGSSMSSTVSNVEAYSKTLSKVTAPNMQKPRNQHKGILVPDSYVLFACGVNASNGPQYSADAYNADLTVTSIDSVGTGAVRNIGTSHVGGYGLLAGGSTYDSGYTSTVVAFDNKLTRTTPAALSSPRAPKGGQIGQYAIFAGNDTTVECYNASLTKSIATALSATMSTVGVSASIDDYAIFITDAGIVNTYNASLTRTILAEAGIEPDTATAVDGIAFFSAKADYTVTLAYDSSLTKTELTAHGFEYASAASVGNYALFGGGRDGSNYNAGVTAYAVI